MTCDRAHVQQEVGVLWRDNHRSAPASEGLQVCFEHEQPSLDAGQAGVGILLQVGRCHQQALHALPDELLLFLQTRLTSWRRTKKNKKHQHLLVFQ